MQARAQMSLLRACLTAPAQLEASLGRAMGASSQLFSTSTSSPAHAPAVPGRFVRPSVLAALRASAQTGNGPLLPTNVRFAGDYKPETPGNTIDNWTEMRGVIGREKPSSLGGNYYMNILVMGFAYWLNDSYYFPSRTLYIGALVFLLLYVRKSTFTTPMSLKTEY